MLRCSAVSIILYSVHVTNVIAARYRSEQLRRIAFPRAKISKKKLSANAGDLFLDFSTKATL